jgi:methylated-DNA-[protein]-cysteine S-methyltransferase
MAVLLIDSPVGPLSLEIDGEALTRIRFLAGDWPRHGRRADPPDPAAEAKDGPRAQKILAETTRQLTAYFEGELFGFDLPLGPEGTPFQRAEWNALLDIPYGMTSSYSELAMRIGQPAAVRAVGAANGQNPLPIVIPCHRVIGRSGDLVGFGGGIAAKRFLLDLESRQRLLPWA